VGIGNFVVSGLLRSPLHRVLSGSTGVIRYVGRRSGRQFMTPTQYLESGKDVIILVGRPDSKTWWRNFRNDQDIDVLVRGTWLPMTGRAVVGTEEPAAIAPLLNSYLRRFPKATQTLGDRRTNHAFEGAVVVWCRPR
jgi:hypothetical protein